MSTFISYINKFIESISTSIGANLNAIPMAIALTILFYFLYKAINKGFTKYSDKLPIEKNIVKFVNTAMNILIIFFSIMIIASALGINTSSLIAAFSIFGLAVSLAVQSIMSNLANALSIYLSKPFKVGDYISVSGIEGTVLDVTFMLTKINTYKNETIFIPNNLVGAAIITNFSSQPKRRIDHSIIVSIDEEIDKVKYSLNNAVVSVPLVLKDEPINIFINSYEPLGVKYSIRCYCNNEDFIECSNSLMENYKINLDKDNIKISTSSFIKV